MPVRSSTSKRVSGHMFGHSCHCLGNMNCDSFVEYTWVGYVWILQERRGVTSSIVSIPQLLFSCPLHKMSTSPMDLSLALADQATWKQRWISKITSIVMHARKPHNVFICFWNLSMGHFMWIDIIVRARHYNDLCEGLGRQQVAPQFRSAPSARQPGGVVAISSWRLLTFQRYVLIDMIWFKTYCCWLLKLESGLATYASPRWCKDITPSTFQNRTVFFDPFHQ